MHWIIEKTQNYGHHQVSGSELGRFSAKKGSSGFYSAANNPSKIQKIGGKSQLFWPLAMQISGARTASTGLLRKSSRCALLLFEEIHQKRKLLLHLSGLQVYGRSLMVEVAQFLPADDQLPSNRHVAGVQMYAYHIPMRAYMM